MDGQKHGKRWYRSMIKKLSKQGDRLVLEIDRALLDQLQIDENTALEVTTDGRTLSVAPVPDEEYREAFERATKSVNEQYAKTFKRLAE
jgi:antitoxin component of MazEF toxin-antitoxin module